MNTEENEKCRLVERDREREEFELFVKELRAKFSNVPEGFDGDSEVNHPDHYTQGSIEVFDFIEDQGLDYPEGNVVKYICRYKHKGTPLKDLKKAKWYLGKLIKRQEKGDA